ncbi:SacI homology domain-containing protein [Phycomyces blakesleeanus]|uniref:SacI homology domain-containing protein n=1 Tax=Phycomyces blakesleeanus TaxID=4837 RepID=A0ABR3BB04_PHYBL
MHIQDTPNTFSQLPTLSSETMYLYVAEDRFVFTRGKNILEIAFEGQLMTRLDNYEPSKDVSIYEVYGIVGIMEGGLEKYLVVITHVQTRGLIFGKPVYSIEKVACLSFNSTKAKDRLNAKAKAIRTPEDSESDEEFPVETIKSTTDTKTENFTPIKLPPPGSGPLTSPDGTNIQPPILHPSNSLITRLKRSLGKKKNEERPILNDGVDEEVNEPMVIKEEDIVESKSAEEDISLTWTTSEDTVLENRLLSQVTELFGRSMFLFSYDLDITNSFQKTYEKTKVEPSLLDLPLYKQVEKRFWWNEHISRDLIKQKLDEWVLPVMQGAMQLEPCEVDGYPFDFVLVSRRSRERAGMRYQRRGINEHGEVANFVETEQIVLFEREGIQHVVSYIQTRGSIPVFWSQSPYSLHPAPTLERTEAENDDAFKAHFCKQESLYGKQIAVNLTELSGRESIVGQEYRKHVEHLGDPNIKYVEFDFHRETKGMRFENISKLSTSLSDDLSKVAYFWEAGEPGAETVYCKQTGVFRTNCMDCLDRTNVVQSAFGRSVLNLQLMRFGITEYPDKGIRFYEEFEKRFNNAWANNGDMISRMYAGTSALKGDFTRTGKRNITGMMNDASNSLARMYFNTVKDFWRQATVDFVLGYHKFEIFRHVPQATLMSAEPGIERRWAKIRSDAVEISSEIVIADDEVKISGWTLLSPVETQKRNAKKFEEKVVLLTEKAIYVCSYNYNLEKVVQFKRISLDTIIHLQIGEYILSSLSPTSRRPDQNYGFLLFYRANGEIVRWNTGSIRNQSLGDLNIDSNETNSRGDSGRRHDSDDNSSDSSDSDSDGDDGNAFVAFKAVRYNALGELPEDKVLNCRDQVRKIVSEIADACGHSTKDERFVEHKPIISLEQAEKTDGIFKTMGYKIKKAIWI